MSSRFPTYETRESMERPGHRGPDQRPGMTVTEIAQLSGVVTRPTVASVSATAGVPGHQVRRGISQEDGRRMAAALSAGLLTERSARAIAKDPQAVIRAAQELQALIWEIMRSKHEKSRQGKEVA